MLTACPSGPDTRSPSYQKERAGGKSGARGGGVQPPASSARQGRVVPGVRGPLQRARGPWGEEPRGAQEDPHGLQWDPAGVRTDAALPGAGAPGAPGPSRAGKAPPGKAGGGAAARGAAGKYRRGRRGGEYFPPLTWKNAKSPPGPGRARLGSALPSPPLLSRGGGGAGRGRPAPVRPPCHRRRRRAGPDPSVGL